VDQICLDEKIKGPVHRGRRGLLTFAIDAIQNVVGSDWLVAVPNELQDTTPYTRKSQAPITTQTFGGFDRRRDTMPMIVLRRRETNRQIAAGHRRDCTPATRQPLPRGSIGKIFREFEYNSAPYASDYQSRIQDANNTTARWFQTQL